MTLENALGGLSLEATQAEVREYLRRRFVFADVNDSVRVTGSGDHTVYTPAAGKSVRLLWIGLSSPQGNPGEVLAIVTVGTIQPYRWNMGNPGAFSRTQIVEGEPDGLLIVNLSAGSNPVDVSFALEEF